MISNKRYLLATHPKLQAITSKSLAYRLIMSYRVRHLTNDFFKWIFESVNRNLVNKFLFLYIIIILFILFIYFSYFILPGTFQYIGIRLRRGSAIITFDYSFTTYKIITLTTSKYVNKRHGKMYSSIDVAQFFGNYFRFISLGYYVRHFSPTIEKW